MRISDCEPCSTFLRERNQEPAFVLTVAFFARAYRQSMTFVVRRFISMHHHLGHPDAKQADEIFAGWEREKYAQWN